MTIASRTRPQSTHTGIRVHDLQDVEAHYTGDGTSGLEGITLGSRIPVRCLRLSTSLRGPA